MSSKAPVQGKPKKPHWVQAHKDWLAEAEASLERKAAAFAELEVELSNAYLENEKLKSLYERKAAAVGELQVELSSAHLENEKLKSLYERKAAAVGELQVELSSAHLGNEKLKSLYEELLSLNLRCKERVDECENRMFRQSRESARMEVFVRELEDKLVLLKRKAKILLAFSVCVAVAFVFFHLI